MQQVLQAQKGHRQLEVMGHQVWQVQPVRLAQLAQRALQVRVLLVQQGLQEVMVQVEDSRARISRLARAKRQSSGPVSVTINAPMPGRVVSIAVEVGMTVGRGDVIAVLEAMKMESSIIATHSGIISEVLIEAGQPVMTRQALVRISG